MMEVIESAKKRWINMDMVWHQCVLFVEPIKFIKDLEQTISQFLGLRRYNFV